MPIKQSAVFRLMLKYMRILQNWANWYAFRHASTSYVSTLELNFYTKSDKQSLKFLTSKASPQSPVHLQL